MPAPKMSWPVPQYLPKSTTLFTRRYAEKCQNLGLLLDRYTPWQMNKDGHWNFTIRVTERRSGREEITPKPGKGLWLSTSGLKGTEVDAPLNPNIRFEEELVRGYYERCKATLDAYSDYKFFETPPEWRFVIGLGGASVLETSMTLHRLYGLPIIPGSALKGVTRAYAEVVLAKPANDPEVVAIFGKPPQATPLEAGEIIFFDAIPVTVPKFKLDIMNPHYPKYYQGDQPPADWQNPTPIYFLTVEQTQFLFAVATRREEGKAYINTALEWLKKGLAELGVGAKTAAGYGYFEEVK